MTGVHQIIASGGAFTGSTVIVPPDGGSYTVTAPPGATGVRIILRAAGGQGAKAPTTGGGGGGGGYCESFYQWFNGVQYSWSASAAPNQTTSSPFASVNGSPISQQAGAVVNSASPGLPGFVQMIANWGVGGVAGTGLGSDGGLAFNGNVANIQGSPGILSGSFGTGGQGANGGGLGGAGSVGSAPGGGGGASTFANLGGGDGSITFIFT